MNESDPTPDLNLVERSRRGDRAAFDQIVRRTAQLVYAHIVLQVRDRQRAEDLTQEVYLTAWRCIKRLGQPAALRNWLLAIAGSTVADDARSRMRLKRGGGVPGGATGLGDVADPAADPAAAAQAADQRDRALDALADLPTAYRQALAMRYLAGADYDGIAKQLALSNGALRGVLHRGIALLRRRLDERGGP